MRSFDIATSPLEGTNLIEADAGTGKTYTIAGLFVRLIVEKGLLVDQILVVTFTKAATAELKDRIYRNLDQVRRAVESGQSPDGLNDALIDSLLTRIKNPKQAHDRIRNALLGFDRAAIFTIHGFCQRVLQQGAFETGSLFNAELVTNPAELVQGVADDFWRHHVYKEPPEFVQYLLQKTRRPKQESGPAYFAHLLALRRFPDMAIVPDVKPIPLSGLSDYHKALNGLRTAWPKALPEIMECLQDDGLTARIYGSKTAKTASGISRRDRVIQKLADDMALLLNPKGIGFPLFKGFEKLTTTHIITKTKKGNLPPSHPVFDLCQQLWQAAATLESQMAQRFIGLECRLYKYADQALKERKTSQGVQFYDDLLLMVRAALKKPAGGLAASLRRKYKAALIDEFQDTDPIQYDIFSRLFDKKPNLLFFIGDPKQAIYGFRGADIFAYLKAAQKAQYKYTLTINWRSTPDLVAAVNTIFSRAKLPFLFENIRFESGRAGLAAPPKCDDSAPPSDLTLWYLPGLSGKPWSKEKAVNRIAAAVAAEIVRIAEPGRGRYEPSDIAVLVRTNRQARIVKQHLAKQQVPAVLYSLDNVFDSAEAAMLGLVLEAVADPGNQERLKGALSSDLLGWQAHDLLLSENDPQAWENLLERFYTYGSTWRQRGFMPMFASLLRREKVKQRLLGLPEGERRLTNLLQLGEILQQAAINEQLNPKQLLKWFARQRHPQAIRQEEHQLRLESDARAVKIVTIHRSKGLQYPVVFCPYTWEGAMGNQGYLLFHDDDDNRTLILDLGSADLEHHETLAAKERLAENLRLLYVGLTRACEKAYLVWGNINTSETSAPAYLFHGLQNSASTNSVADLKQLMASKSDSDLQTDLKELVKQSKGAIRLEPLPADNGLNLFPKAENQNRVLGHRHFSGKISRGWGITSYSALVQSGLAAETGRHELPDRDSLFETAATGLEAEQKQTQQVAQTMADFPRGARAGTFIHELLEHLDFERYPDPAQLQLVEEKLSAHGYESHWQGPVNDMLAKVLNAALPGPDDPFTLSAISAPNQICEMSFFFPIRKVSPKVLSTAFKDLSNDRSWISDMGKLTFAPTQGYMRGFIDLVFQHQDRFYFLDWKSNYLGDRPEDYGPAALADAMQTHYYDLQYHLYVLALHRYLQSKLPGYAYEKHFGGVFYVFLRGVDPASDPGNGIFFDRPETELVNRLERKLIKGFKGSRIQGAKGLS